MKKLLTSALCLAAMTAQAAQPDSVFVRFSSPAPTEGLRAEWSVDKKTWMQTGNGFNLVKSDFGTWGAEKKMYAPSVLLDNGRFYAVWAVNNRVHQIATCWSDDLFLWKPQDYPFLSTTGENVVEPVLTKEGNLFVVTYKTSKGNVYRTTSADFKTWSPSVKAGETKTSCGVMKVPYSVIGNLNDKVQAHQYRSMLEGESTRDDARRFARLNGISANISVKQDERKAISPDLYGIFFEDINYAADGGIYAELLQNRDFEYSKKDNGKWDAKTSWRMDGEGTSWTIETQNPLHVNNPHHAVLKTERVGAALVNEGFDGIALKGKARYDFSMFLKGKGKVRVSLVADGQVLASATIAAQQGWKLQSVVLTPKSSAAKAELRIEPLQVGELEVDFVSLFPQDTYKGRKNGMRRDMAELLEAMRPRFIRFPGGCASHGQGLDNIYHWNHTVGKLWERKPDMNIWNYHQSRGMGFYEYFQLCEDLGAEPLPVLAAGVPCQNSRVGGDGQQGGLPWAKDAKEGQLTMEQYLQELLDLIEWANGDAKTSKWAKMRAEAGHPKPFNMKYLGIGNEDLISDVFIERYKYLVDNVKKAHPEITIVGTVGPFYEGSDYEFGWKYARENGMDIVDEHYYNPVGWYLNNQDFYDKYDRNGTKVYLGEWASKGNRLENALAEALHITNVERNADVVVMSSYAPLFGKDGHCQWNPDMIYFNNEQTKPTCNYWVQQLSGANSGDEYIYSEIKMDYDVKEGRKDLSFNDMRKRIGVSCVSDSKTGDIILKLVNMLPVEAKVAVSGVETKVMGKKGETERKAVMSTLAGKPNESWQKPVAVEGTAAELLAKPLPPYSFTVIRIKK